MSDEYTPTTDDVKRCYVYTFEADDPAAFSYTRIPAEQFDRWLAAHDADLTARLTAAEDDFDALAELSRRNVVRLAAAEATIAEALHLSTYTTARAVSERLADYRPVVAHTEVESGGFGVITIAGAKRRARIEKPLHPEVESND